MYSALIQVIEVLYYILYYTGLLILGLGILVMVHELGHFLPAKYFGMRVERFYLFFDWPTKLFSFKKGDTEYGIGVLPLGGYVKISGIIDESLDTTNQNRPPEPWEFRAKPVWQRLIVMVGGVTMNVILGVLIFTVLRWYEGESKLPMDLLIYGVDVGGSITEELGFKSGDKIISFNGKPIVYLNEIMTPGIFLETDASFTVLRDGKEITIDIPNDFIRKITEKPLENPILFHPNGLPIIKVMMPQGAGAKAGLIDGDKILAINGIATPTFADVRSTLKGLKNQTIQLVIERNNQPLTLQATLDESGKLGIDFDRTQLTYVRLQHNIASALVAGAYTAFSIITDNIKGLRKLFTGNVGASSMSGPVRIAKIMGNTFDRSGWYGFWVILGTLSMILAFMNILPIPALDGGHVVFLLIEAVMRKEPSLQFRIAAQQVGMILLLGLTVFILFNDIIHL
jgi:regulator of sigma E protease